VRLLDPMPSQEAVFLQRMRRAPGEVTYKSLPADLGYFPRNQLTTSACAQDLEAALGKVVDQYGWKGLVGCSITKAVARGLGVHTSSFSAMDREVGAILQSCLPHNQVITLIHTEAAGYAELAYDEEEEFNQV
jgi:hypothetical protein